MIFDPSNIHRSIEQTLQQSGAPPDHTKAFIVTGTTRDGGGVKAIYVEKIGRGWSVGGSFELAREDMVAEGGVIWTGK